MSTMLDLAKRLIPNEPDEVLGFVLWNHTPYPFSSVLKTARSLKQWKRYRDAGLSSCAICGSSHDGNGEVILGGECGLTGCPEA